MECILTFFQCAECFLYAAESLGEIFVGGGVAQADIAGSAEGGAGNGGYMSLFEEIHGKVGVGGDGAAVGGFGAKICAHFGEEVEGTLRLVDAKAGNLAGEAHHEVAAALEGAAHFLYALLRAGVGGLGGFLGY